MVGASPITREIFNGNVNVDDDVVLLNQRNTACVVTFVHRLLILGTFFANHSNYRYVTSVNVGDVANSACVASQQG